MDRSMKKLLLVGENALRDDLKSTIGGDDIKILTATSGEVALSCSKKSVSMRLS